MEKRKLNKKGQVFGSLINIFYAILAAIVVAVVMLVVNANLLTSNLTRSGSAFQNNATIATINNGTTLILNTFSQFPTAGIIIGLGIILSVVFAFLGLRGRLGGGNAL